MEYENYTIKAEKQCIGTEREDVYYLEATKAGERLDLQLCGGTWWLMTMEAEQELAKGHLDDLIDVNNVISGWMTADA